MRCYLATFCLLTLLALLAGCGQPPVPVKPVAGGQEEEPAACVAGDDRTLVQVEEEAEQPFFTEESPGGVESLVVRKDPALCYRLQPSVPTQGQKKKKGVGTVACCQPQSLIYARCRSGIDTCKLGDTSPGQWFSCAKKKGNTSTLPASGTIMVLDADSRRKMHTGHPLYVENARKNGNGTWLLRVSHTNYDRRCSLDQDAEVVFDPGKMTVAFQSGHWSGWARDLKILGFITR
jgi:hypothetical protein